MAEPVGGTLGRHPGYDENDSLPRKGFRANLQCKEHLRPGSLLEITLGGVVPFP